MKPMKIMKPIKPMKKMKRLDSINPIKIIEPIAPIDPITPMQVLAPIEAVATFQTKKMIISLISVICCIIMSVGTFFLVRKDLFPKPEISIEFNNNETIFDENDLQLQPDTSIKKDITIKNTGKESIYYKIFMENVSGNLSEILEFRIYRQDTLIKVGNAKSFSKDDAMYNDIALEPEKTDSYVIEAYMPKNSGNSYINGDINFDLVVNASLKNDAISNKINWGK